MYMHSLNKHFLHVNYVLSTISGTRDIAVKKSGKIPLLMTLVKVGGQ